MNPLAPVQVTDDSQSDNPFVAQSPTLADGWQANSRAYADWVAQQRADGVARGLIDPQTGWPTGGALIDAAHQFGSALIGGTAAPEGGSALTAGFRAYHGSPHSFDKFDSSAIGTGEGAQVYGHGLYFADNEGVAQTYRDNLAPYNFNETGSGAPISSDVSRMLQDGHDSAASQGIRAPSANDAIFMAQKSLNQQRADALKAGDFDWFNKVSDRAAELDRISRDQPVTKGTMYEVNVGSDPAHFLDFDAPLGAQSDHVKNAIGFKGVAPPGISETAAAMKAARAAGVPFKDFPAYKALQDQLAASKSSGFTGLGIPQSNIPGMAAGDLRGSEYLAALTDKHGGPAQAAEALKAAGIAGIRYLDAGSRMTGGNGTRNTVVFDPSTISIMRKYGLIGLAGGSAAAANASGESQ